MQESENCGGVARGGSHAAVQWCAAAAGTGECSWARSWELSFPPCSSASSKLEQLDYSSSSFLLCFVLLFLVFKSVVEGRARQKH